MLPFTLQFKLETLGFTGDFTALGLSVEDALAMPPDALMRLIHEKTGMHGQFVEQREKQTNARNKQFFKQLYDPQFQLMPQGKKES